MIKFDIKKALAGEPVVLRNGFKAYVRHHETQVKTVYPFIGYVDDVEFTEEAASWTEDGLYYWDHEESAYDIVGMWSEPLMFEHWDLLSKRVKFIAKDVNGCWHGSSVKPFKDGGGWIIPRYTDYYSLAALDRSLFPNCEWEHSLIERP